MVHELRVHQIQLEMQNEELRRTHAELEATKARYFDLYDLAPVGYITLSDTGLILEANLTAATLLGVSRNMLLKRPFSQFIVPQDQDAFYLYRTQGADDCLPHSCELRLVQTDDRVVWVRLVASAVEQAGGGRSYRIVLSDITEQKQAEQAMREQHALFMAVFEESPDILIVQHPDHTIKYFNTAGHRLLGLTRDDVKGKKCYQLIGRTSECEECASTKALNSRKSEQLEKYMPEIQRYMECRSYPILDGDGQVVYLVEQLRDITERRRMEEALRESENRRLEEQKSANAQLREHSEYLISIYQALDSVGLIVCDLVEHNALIKIFNTGAEKLLGYRPDEAVGQSVALIFPPEFIDCVPDGAQWFSVGNPLQSHNTTLVRRSGERFPAIISVHPFDCREGRCRKAVAIFRDISELMEFQHKLEAMNEELERRVEQRTRELKETQKQYLHAEKLSVIGTLSASIAHEFNNPLQGILSILKGLQKRATMADEDRALLEEVISESDRMKELIRGLQEFNRPSSGRMMPMDVHAALDSMLLLHKSDLQGKRIAVERNYAEHLPEIMAVPDQIKQVLLNLLSNAAYACRKGGGVISVTTRQEDSRVAITIKDNGIGIKPEEMALIFQPFYTTKPEVKGTGLGLSVCHGIVESHGGEIRVESRPGEGAAFTVLLPIKAADDNPEAVDRSTGCSEPS
jgi:PAS domain S-box-containing protein